LKRAPLILQLTALTLLAGLIVLIVFSKGLLRSRPERDPKSTRATAASGLLPEGRGRVFYARADEALFLLAPLDLLPSRVTFDRRWLEATLGESTRGQSFLVLHVFQRGRETPFRFDPARDRMEVQLASGAPVVDQALASDVAEARIAASDRLVFRTLVPEAPVELTGFATARLLFRFPAADVWAGIEGARLRLGDGEVSFRAAEVPHMAWESVLAGGPVEDATFPRRREASAPDSERAETPK